MIRVRRVSEAGHWIFRRGVYEIELAERSSRSLSWTRRTTSPTRVLRPLYGLGDAWSVVRAADAAEPPATSVSFHEEDAARWESQTCPERRCAAVVSGISVGSLRQLLAGQFSADDLHATAVAVLDSLDPQRTLVLTEQITSKVRSIYTRRARRSPEASGLVHLAEQLNVYEGSTLLSTSVTGVDQVVYVWLDNRGSRLLGCIVGADRREA